MDKPTAAILTVAKSVLGKGAAKIASRSGRKGGLSDDEKQMIVAFGTARDWLRWAASMSDITFFSKGERDSARKAGILESIRFLQIWTAANALFSKDPIIALVRHSPGSAAPDGELKRFKVLYEFAKIPPVRETEYSQTLEKLLGMDCKAADVIIKITGNNSPTMWEVIDQKYVTPAYQNRRPWKRIHSALAAGKKPTVILPEVKYLARNWAVHGVLTSSFFRGSKMKYLTFVGTLIKATADVLQRTATGLLPLL